MAPRAPICYMVNYSAKGLCCTLNKHNNKQMCPGALLASLGNICDNAGVEKESDPSAYDTYYGELDRDGAEAAVSVDTASRIALVAIEESNRQYPAEPEPAEKSAR